MLSDKVLSLTSGLTFGKVLRGFWRLVFFERRLNPAQSFAARPEVVERFARAKCSDLGGAEARKSEARCF